MAFEMTHAGERLALMGLTGTQINFTSVKLGNGVEQPVKTAVELNNPLITLDALEVSLENGYATVNAVFDNSTVESELHITEVGVFAEDPEDSSKEILYAYECKSIDHADRIPSNADEIYGMELNYMVFVGEAENITASVNKSLVYASAEDFNSHRNNKSNPHGVTKEDIGLGNVANTSPEETVLEYSVPNKLSELVPGEKNSAAFGKIAAAVKAFISHIGAKGKDNPHALAAEDIGAADKTHTHSADAINSGVLGQKRGGTGCGSVDDFLKSVREKIHIPVFGRYAGNGAVKRFIDLGFTPGAVFVIGVNGAVNSEDGIYGGLALADHGAAASGFGADTWDDATTAVMIDGTGFYVNYSEGHNIKTNKNDIGYHYIAWR